MRQVLGTCKDKQEKSSAWILCSDSTHRLFGMWGYGAVSVKKVFATQDRPGLGFSALGLKTGHSSTPGNPALGWEDRDR